MDDQVDPEFAAISLSMARHMVNGRRDRMNRTRVQLAPIITSDGEHRATISGFRDCTRRTHRVIDQDDVNDIVMNVTIDTWWNSFQSVPISLRHECVIIYQDTGHMISQLLIRKFVKICESGHEHAEHEGSELVINNAAFILDFGKVFTLSCRYRFRSLLPRLHRIQEQHLPHSIEHYVLDSHLDCGRSRAVLSTIQSSGKDPLLFVRYCWRIWSESWPDLCRVAAIDLYPVSSPGTVHNVSNTWLIFGTGDPDMDYTGLHWPLHGSAARQTPDSHAIFLTYLDTILHHHVSSRQDADITDQAIEMCLHLLYQDRDRLGQQAVNAIYDIYEEIVWHPSQFEFTPYLVLERVQSHGANPRALIPLYAHNPYMASAMDTLKLALDLGQMEQLSRLAHVRTFSRSDWLYLLDNAISGESVDDPLLITLEKAVELVIDCLGCRPSIRLFAQSRRALSQIPTSRWWSLFAVHPDRKHALLGLAASSPTTSSCWSGEISSECRICWRELQSPDTTAAHGSVPIRLYKCGHPFHLECVRTSTTCPTCFNEVVLRKELQPPASSSCRWSSDARTSNLVSLISGS